MDAAKYNPNEGNNIKRSYSLNTIRNKNNSINITNRNSTTKYGILCNIEYSLIDCRFFL